MKPIIIDNDENAHANELFSLTIEEVDLFMKEIKHAQIDSTDMLDLAKRIGILGSGSIGYKSFIFGRLCQKNEIDYILHDLLKGVKK
jgi:hypothetical protein